MRLRRLGQLAACAAVVGGSIITIAPTTGAATVARTYHSGEMIVFLKNTTSISSNHARSSGIVRQQVNAVARSWSTLGVKVLRSTSFPATVTVMATAAQAQRLAASSNVAAILPESLIPGPSASNLVSSNPSGTGSVIPASAPVCGTASSPQLNPEALTNINAPAAWSSGATGQGVLVATIADGTDVTNPDLQRNPAYASGGSPAGSALRWICPSRHRRSCT